MTKRMLIDATHAEETRVVVLDGTRLEDFDVETSTKRQLKGNIYLAKVVRVEPSLQAAFVEYGGNRHGFLAFSEIHPDYYQIPVADRQRLIELQAEEARREDEEDDLELALGHATYEPQSTPSTATPIDGGPFEPRPAETPSLEAGHTDVDNNLDVGHTEAGPVGAAPEAGAEPWALASTPHLLAAGTAPGPSQVEAPAIPTAGPLTVLEPEEPQAPGAHKAHVAQTLAIEVDRVVADDTEVDDGEAYEPNGEHIEALPPPETVGGGGDQENHDEQRERRMPPRFLRNYKIQEVIRRRQILLVQVVKEERGTKGAALTTYLSLAGRFGVLMPNSPRGGGISRKITSAADRRRLKEVMAELDIPRGMGMIVRTAGANRPKPEIKRDCEYLLRLWDDIREHTMKSVAPALIYEEASLIKRAIRDVYSRDIDEILVDGEDGWRAAHDFMRMLMPAHAKKVQLWRDGGQPLFARNQVEAQLDGMLMPTVQLRSGGYLVINQAEALVAIDVNSGRSTRERNVEETALRTNLEAADEVARQLRLRDLAGLIVIDFIDMESKRHNAMVERRIKDALKNDRARIQVGHISHFGLLEMSRQRLRPSLAETSFIPCPSCGGTGHVRSTENAAIHVLRGIEDEGGKRRSAEIIVYVATPVALYLLNHKRERLREIEVRYAMRVVIAADDAQIAPQFRIEKVRTRSPDEIPPVVMIERPMASPPIEEVDEYQEEEAEPVAIEEDDEEETPEQLTTDAAGGADEAERRQKRRRRRRRGARRDEPQVAATGAITDDEAQPAMAALADGNEPPRAATELVTAEANQAFVESQASPAAAAADELAADRPAAPGHASQPEAQEPGARESIAQEPGVQATAEIDATAPPTEEEAPNRRRGRRGGRRRRRDSDNELSPFAEPGADQPELQPVYAGPTPADPFGGRAFDIFDVMDQVERAAETIPSSRANSATEIVNNTPPEPGAAQEEVASKAADATARTAEVTPMRAAPIEHLAASLGVRDEAPAKEETTGLPRPEPEIVNIAAPEPAPSSLSDGPTAIRGDTALDGTAHDNAALEGTGHDGTGHPIGSMTNGSVPPDAGVEDTVIADPPPEPLIKPILIGASGEPAERKRGWWRR